jgi:5-methylcytosine-specific restriction endonuclease McrA
MEQDLSRFVISILRRASYMWKPRYAVIKAARVAKAQSKCAMCSNVFSTKDTVADHIHPVVDPAKGFENWDTYIKRLFCEESGFQILCKPCHKIKTDEENKTRKKLVDAP